MVCPEEAVRLLDGVHVLVVDDEALPRALFHDVLELAGARVTVAASAREALESIERDVPDVVVSDIMMPHQDGYWLIAALQAVRARTGGRPRAVAITGDPRRHSPERTRQAGFDAHLTKPMGVDELSAAVASLAGRF
jgi:CheY-like chemotaxis protein